MLLIRLFPRVGQAGTGGRVDNGPEGLWTGWPEPIFVKL